MSTQVFIVDFFADSPAASEWRLLAAYLADLAQADGLSGDGHVYTLQQVTPPDPGAVRPLAFDPDGGHVLLAEELKHLYTAITRAKNNVRGMRVEGCTAPVCNSCCR